MGKLTIKVWENNDLMMYFKKRHCRCCGNPLQRKRTENLLLVGTPEHRAYLFNKPRSSGTMIYYSSVRIIIARVVTRCFLALNKSKLLQLKNITKQRQFPKSRFVLLVKTKFFAQRRGSEIFGGFYSFLSLD